MKKRLIPVFIALLLICLIALRSYKIVDGVTGIRLAAGCEIELFDTTRQPFWTAVLACPQQDMLRFWPLPIVQPWFEDWRKMPRDNKRIESLVVLVS